MTTTDPSSPEQVRLARRALARAIWRNGAQGFASGREPTPDDFGDPLVVTAWQDCSAAAAQSAPAASSGEPVAEVYFAGLGRPQDDAGLLREFAGLGATSSAAEIGPFRRAPSSAPYHLYIFDAVSGLKPGLYPSQATAAKAAVLTVNKLLPAWGAALGFLMALAALGFVEYKSYRAGVSASTAAVAPAGMPGRLAAAVATADTRISDSAPVLAETLLIDLKFMTPEGEMRTAREALRASGINPSVNEDVPLRATEIQVLEKATAEHAKTRLIPIYANLKKLSPAEQAMGVEKTANALAIAVREDPAVTARTINLTVWWFAAMATLVLIAGLVGKGMKGSVVGILIDSRNRLSLSNLQLAVWTITVLGLFSVTCSFLIAASDWATVLPAYPGEIWALLGISLSTAPLSGLILLNKTGQEPDPRSQAIIDADRTADNVGLLESKIGPNSWSFLDFFRGEEIANRDQVDISRFQFVVITVSLVTIFCGMTSQALWHLTPGTDWVTWAKNSSYPNLNATFIGLLVLSHGGYLGMKALTKPVL